MNHLDAWHHVLVLEITRQDQRQEAAALKAGRQFNVYSLSLMLGAAQDVLDSVRKTHGKDTVAAQVARWRILVEDAFTQTRMRDKVLIEVTMWLSNGKVPKEHTGIFSAYEDGTEEEVKSMWLLGHHVAATRKAPRFEQ